MTNPPKAELRKHRIFNPHDLAELQAEPQVFIVYSPQELGRAMRFAAWNVCRIGFKTDLDAHWQDHGNKTFNCFRPRDEKEPKRLEAIAWATERYGITEWERSPFGSYHPAGTMARVVRHIMEAGYKHA